MRGAARADLVTGISVDLGADLGVDLDDLSAEHVCKVADEERRDVGDVRRRSEQRGDGGDAATRDPARHDCVVVAQVGVHVERQAVHRYPPAQLDTHRAHLLPADPHAGQAGLAAGGQTERTKRADRHLFERAHVPMHVAPVVVKVDDWIGGELARPVVGHLAAALGMVDGETERAPEVCGIAR